MARLDFKRISQLIPLEAAKEIVNKRKPRKSQP